MKLTLESKNLVEAINTVSNTTGSATLNMEVDKRGIVYLKSNAKGCSHHLRTTFIATDFEKDFRVSINVPQLLGIINRKGEITLEVNDDNILEVSNKRFNAKLALVPALKMDKIEDAENTVVLESNTLAAMWDRLNGVHVTNLYQQGANPFIRIRCAKGLLEMGASDSVHMAYYRIDVDKEQQPFEFDLDFDLLRRLLSIIVDNPDAKFAIEDTRVYVKSTEQSVSFPKQQSRRLDELDLLHNLAKSLRKAGGTSNLTSIPLESLMDELRGCRAIASDKASLEIIGGKKGKGLVLAYQTSFGSYKAKVDCENEWSPDDHCMIDPLLFEDFLSTLCLYEKIDISIREGKLFSAMKGDGYESFHVCTGN